MRDDDRRLVHFGELPDAREAIESLTPVGERLARQVVTTRYSKERIKQDLLVIARDVQGLAAQIETQVGSVAAIIRTAAETAVSEAEKSRTVILALGELRKEVGALAEGSQSIAVFASSAV